MEIAKGRIFEKTLAEYDYRPAIPKHVVLSDGVVALGVNPMGNLIVPGQQPSQSGQTDLGLRYLPTNDDALAPDCDCEGWGVADAKTGRSTGYVDTDSGMYGLRTLGFTSAASTATSRVQVQSSLEVDQRFAPASETPNLYQIDVTIANIGTKAVQDLRYRRVMDWDVEPTPFDEFVTLQAGSSPEIGFTSDDGFASPNPLAGDSSIDFTGSAVDSGPDDHGALFDLKLGSLAPGASTSFTMFYGATESEASAEAALTAVGAEAYSFGQPDTRHGADQGLPNTFIFALRGIGG